MNGLTMTASSLCQDGMWVTEPHAIELLKFGGASELKEKLNSNALPYVHVEQANKPNVPSPFNKHVFYYVGPLGTAVSRLSMSLQFLQWVELCIALDSTEASQLDPKVLTLFSKYSGNGINMQTLASEVADMKRIKAVLPIASLAEEGEIYIRADGKKVRRVTKTVVRSRSGVSDDGNATPTTDAEGEIYTRADGKRVRRVKKSVSNAPGDLASLSGHTANTNTSASQDEGEIIVRADGTKVRRIRKTVARSNSDDMDKKPSSSLPNGGLTSFIGNSAGGPGKKSGSATVTGATVGGGEIYINKDGKRVRRVKKAPVTPSAGDLGSSGLDNFVGNGNGAKKKGGAATVSGSTPSKYPEGEIYTRADGKRVRRVKKAPDASAVSAEPPTTPVSKDEGEIIVRADGTKVRRIRKTIARSNSSDGLGAKPSNGGLTSFIGNSAGGPGRKSGSATVTGATTSKSVAGGEVYINKDGKKVRRVKKTPVTPTAAGDAPALEGFLDTSIKKKKKKGFGSASVGGDESNGLNGFLDTSIKKEKKKKNSGSASVGGSVGGDASEGLNGFLDTTFKKKKKKNSGSASVDGDVSDGLNGFLDTSFKKKKKKKKGSGSASVGGSVGGDASEGLNGFLDTSKKKKKKKNSGSASVGGSVGGGASDGLHGFLDTSIKKKKKKGSGSASVGGDVSGGLGDFVGTGAKKSEKGVGSASLGVYTPTTPTKSSTEGEIYTRADGKRVRRVKKNTGDTATTNGSKENSLDGLLASGASSSPTKSGSATVSGDIISNKADEYEIIVRDGKKFRRRKLPTAPTNDSEVYRRADGKLVRRMKKEAPSPQAAGDLAGFLDVKAGGEQKTKSGSATVVGNTVAPSFSELLKSKNDGFTSKDRPTTPQTAPMSESSGHQKENQPEDPASSIPQSEGVAFSDATKRQSTHESATANNGISSSAPIQLGEDDQAVANFYLKKKKMGMPDVAIRHKMEQDEVDAHVIAFVMGDQAPAAAPLADLTPKSQTPAPASRAAPHLSEDDQAVANFYLKKKKMGMPDVAIRHKMEQDEVDAQVIAFVMGDHAPAAAPSADLMPKSQGPTPTAGVAPPLSEDDQAVANFYLKKKKMGMPDVAIRHKMEQDEVDAQVIAFVMGDHAPAAARSADLMPKSQAPAPTAGVAPPLSDDDEAVANFYLKKKKMGMPDVAIRHKMEQDEVDAHVIAFVMGDQAPAAARSPDSTPMSQTPAPITGSAPPSGVAPSLSGDDQAVANFYLKKKKMGMPDVAIRHKMEQDEVGAQVIAFVMGDQAPAAPAPTTSAAPPLSEDDQAVANFYLKKKKMGMPDVAIRHKMEQDEVDAQVIAFVMGDHAPAAAPSAHEDANKAISTSPASAAQAPQTEASVPVSSQPYGPQQPALAAAPQPPAAVAYKVVIGDAVEPEPKSLAAALQASKPLEIDSDSRSVGTVAPDEKFAVKVNDDKTETTPGESGQPEAKTRFLTLDELAKMSGQSRDSLEQLVTEKRTRGQSPPRFSLQPIEPQEQLYECAMPQARPKSTGTPARAPSGGDQKNMSEVKDGHEIVNSDLANTARAVSALGDGDMASLIAKLQSGDVEGLLTRLREAEKRQKKLEKQLAQSGIAIAEDIDYGECQEKVLSIAKRMGEIGGSDVTNPDKSIQNKLREEYFKLEQGMERYNTALMLTEEYQAEQARIEKKWEDDNWPDNLEALKKIRRHMPVNIKNMSEAELTNQPTPNGKFLPNAIAKKFKRTNVLQCLRLNPMDLERMHPSSLENMRVTGLTLTERRALYAHLKVLGPKWEKNKSEKMTERKWTWYKMMKNNFKENLAPYQRHVAQYGPPGNHPYATRDNPDVGCPMIGKQCPIKADKLPDYDNDDYGYTDKEEYLVSSVQKPNIDDPGAKAMAEALELVKEKKANERGETLKTHYKGKLLQVSKANGSCEAMDDAMDKLEYHTLKWIEFDLEHPDEKEDDKKKEISLFMDATNELKLAVLDFAQRSGMQMSGRKKAGGDADDIRSSIECRLSEDLFECAQEFFSYIKKRVKEIAIKDTRLEKTVELLDSMLTELHEKNIATLEKLGVKRGDKSRKLKKNSDMRKEAEEKMAAVPAEGEAEDDAPAPPGGGGGGGGRGGLLDGIAGRGGRGGGRGGLLDGIAGRGGRGGGRGGLLDGIAGRGGRGKSGGGRGGLLDGIAARGRGGGGGGRGGLLDGIAARGRGGGGGGRGGLLDGIAARGGGGGRGGLLDGIAARGRGRGGGGGGGDGGGRGGLMAAIAARGGG